jgi:hypothetical protein
MNCVVISWKSFHKLARRFADEGRRKLALEDPKPAAGVAGLSLRPKRVGNVKEINRTLSRLNVEKNEA